jgi:hypothetical protein
MVYGRELYAVETKGNETQRIVELWNDSIIVVVSRSIWLGFSRDPTNVASAAMIVQGRLLSFFISTSSKLFQNGSSSYATTQD